MRKYTRRYTSSKSEAVEFNGITFRRYPYAKQWSHRVYYSPHGGHRRNGVGALHQELWKWHHGPIPKGHEINHIDGNPLNNSIENLECITKAEHDLRHYAARSRRQRSPDGVVQFHAARLKAVAWHQSPAGRAWHSRHARLQAKRQRSVKVICSQCKGEYETKAPHRSKFCSQKCRQQSYRNEGRYADRPYVKDRKRK